MSPLQEMVGENNLGLFQFTENFNSELKFPNSWCYYWLLKVLEQYDPLLLILKYNIRNLLKFKVQKLMNRWWKSKFLHNLLIPFS